MSEHQKEAMQDPGDLYNSPEEVLKDKSLSHNEKRKVLTNWADEMQHILESEAENMCADEGTSCEAELLQKITKALDSLD